MTTIPDTRPWAERLHDVRARRAALLPRRDTALNEVERFIDLDAERTLTDGENERYARAIRAADKIIEEAEALRKEEDELMRTVPTSHVQSGDGAITPDFQVMTRGGDPWAGEIRHSSPTELRDRALYAVERSERITDEMGDIVETLIDEKNTPAPNLGSRWMIETSRPAYRSGFEKFLMHGDQVAMYTTDEERDAFQKVEEVRAAWAEGSTTTGGFAVPADYDLNLLLINSGSTNPFRKISRVIPTTSNVWKGLSSAGVTASWNTESTESTDRTPAVAQPSITVYKGDAYLQASYEVLQDSDLGAEVAFLIADARDQLEASAHAVGTGGGQPYGVITRCQSLNTYVFGDSGSTVEKDLVISDIYAMDNALPDRYYGNASWVANRAILNSIRRFGEGSAGSNSAFWADLGANTPSLLLGHPTYASSAMDGTIVSGSQDSVLLIGDFRQGYAIVDRVGTSIVAAPVVWGSNRRPTGEAGFYAYFRSGADVIDQTNASHFKLLRK